MPGKVDWLAHDLPVEGDSADAPTAGRMAHDDVVRCRPEDRASTVLGEIKRSRYPFALVTTPGGTVLGRVRASALQAGSQQPVGEIAEPGPKTFRPHHSAQNVAGELADRDLRWAIITTPEGRLLGVASREDLSGVAQRT